MPAAAGMSIVMPMVRALVATFTLVAIVPGGFSENAAAAVNGGDQALSVELSKPSAHSFRDSPVALLHKGAASVRGGLCRKFHDSSAGALPFTPCSRGLS